MNKLKVFFVFLSIMSLINAAPKKDKIPCCCMCKKPFDPAIGMGKPGSCIEGSELFGCNRKRHHRFHAQCLVEWFFDPWSAEGKCPCDKCEARLPYFAINQAELPVAVAQTGNFSFFKYLIKWGYYVDSNRWLGITPLMMAARQNHQSIVEYLLKKKATLDMQNYKGKNALMYAAKMGNVAICEMLLNAGASLKQVNKKGMTALMYAAREGHLLAVERLVAYGAKVNEVDNNGKSALSYASENGHTFVVIYLKVGAQAVVDVVDEHGRTPLMWAACEGNEFMVRTLSNLGADHKIRDHHNQSAQDLTEKETIRSFLSSRNENDI